MHFYRGSKRIYAVAKHTGSSKPNPGHVADEKTRNKRGGGDVAAYRKMVVDVRRNNFLALSQNRNIVNGLFAQTEIVASKDNVRRSKCVLGSQVRLFATMTSGQEQGL